MLRHVLSGRISKLSFRKYSSVLFIPGDKAQTQFAVLSPHIDFDSRLINKSELLENLESRKLDIDLERVCKQWDFYKLLYKKREILECTRSEIAKIISKLMEDPEKNEHDIESLKLHTKEIKNDLRNVKDFSYGVEENAILSVLALPNVLHVLTPRADDKIIHQHLDKPTHASDNHVAIGVKKKLIHFVSNKMFFLKSDAALTEHALTNFFNDSMLTANFIPFSNSDFVRSVVVEGCGSNFSNFLTLEEPQAAENNSSKLHITGGASLHAFMAFFTKYNALPNVFPIKYFCFGRRYRETTGDNSLFNACQESALSIFVATLEEESLQANFESLKRQLIELYSSLEVHFRLVLVRADKLEQNESLRLSIEMFSNNLECYIEVGNVSLHESYISKRLLFTSTQDKERVFPLVMSGQIVNVTKLIGCLIENHSGHDSKILSDFLKKYI